MRRAPNPRRTRATPNERFDRWIEADPNTGCWLWSGCGLKSGYGAFNRGDGVMVLTHRYAYERHYGPIPDGMFVCHRCDTPACVNPAHLFAGSPRDNTQDMLAKGRWIVPERVGEANGRAKLTAATVAEIRARLSVGEKPARLAEEFGVTTPLIYQIRRGTIWAGVDAAA